MKWRLWRSERSVERETCSGIEPLLSLYSDKMASSGEARRVEQHLSVCEDCRQALRWMQTTRLVIAERPPVVPPADMRLRIARAIADSAPAPALVFATRRSPAQRRAAWAAAASLVTLGVAAQFLTKPQPHVHPVAPTTVAGTPRTPAAPGVRPLPAKLAQKQPPAVKTPVHHGSPLLMAARNTPGPMMDKTLIRTLPAAPRVAQAAPSDFVPALPERSPSHSTLPAVKHTSPAPPALLASQGDAAASRVKIAHGPTPPAEAVTPQPSPSPEPVSVAPPVVIASAPLAPVVEARNDVPEPSPARPGRGDLLSSVRTHVASLNDVSVAKKVYRDSSVRVQVAAYNAGADPGKFVQQPITYTDGFNPKQ